MRWWSRIAVPAAILCAVVSASSAVAQYVGTTAPLFPTLMVPMFPNGNTIPFSGQSTGGGSTRAATIRTAPPAASLLASGPAQIDVNAADLATHFPPASRARIKTTYAQSFAAFKQLERKLRLTDNDVSNGISAYIAGNYMILHGIEVADPDFVKLVSQVRRGLLQNPGFQKIPAAQKRRLYEQTAMVGMFMAIAQISRKTTAEDPNAIRNLQDSSRANLELVLGKRASNLRIDSEGMHL